MKTLGITGGIGSGKSVVSHILASMGIPVYIADDAAKALYDKDAQLCSEMKALFGEGIFNGNKIDRAALARLVFNDASSLRQLNALVHPALVRDFQAWQAQQHCPIVAFESAILFQSELGLHFDFIVTVSAPEELRIERVCKRNNISVSEVKARMQHQLPQATLEQKADAVIVNDNRQAILPQLLTILHQL